MGYELIRECFPVARKNHRCIWCGESILIGEKHRHEISTFFDDLQDHRWHLECDKDAESHFEEGGEFCPHENERPKAQTKTGG